MKGHSRPPILSLEFSTRQRQAAARFWSHVDITANPDECWEWTGYRTNRGYGQVSFPEKIVYQFWPSYPTHRVAFALVAQYYPVNHVLHSCDNRACCNPNHLREGTNQDNMRDVQDRRRNPKYKLTRDQQDEIVALVKSEQLTNRAIARQYGVDPGNVAQLARRRIPNYTQRQKDKRLAKCQQVQSRNEQIYAEWQPGVYGYTKLARKYKVSTTTIRNVLIAEMAHREDHDTTLSIGS